MTESPGHNPGEGKTTRRSFLFGGAAIIAEGILGGCSKNDDKPVSNERVENLPAEHSTVRGLEIDRELERFLNRDVLKEELAKSVEGSAELKAELDRISSSEKAVYYAVQYGASTAGLEKKFGQVLEDGEYRKRVNGLVRKYCAEFKVPYAIAYGVAANESGFNSSAESQPGAKGIFQLMPDTASSKDLQLEGADDIEKNIYAGIKYLRFMYDRYGQWSMAVMAYSTGSGSFNSKLHDKAKLDYRKEYGNDQEHWHEFLQKNKVNAVKLYSKKHYGLGGMHPFQYPFYVTAISELASRIMQGEFTTGNIPDLMAPNDFRSVCKKYSAVKERIKNKVGTARASEIFKRLKVE